MEGLRGSLASGLIAVATALAVVALAIPLFLNPVWVAFEQERAEAPAWTGFSVAELRTATDAILADLVLGPPAFDAEVAGAPVLNERERSHMRDVRTVFMAFFVVAGLALGGAVVLAARRRGAARLASWRAVRTGALGLVVGLVAAGAIALVAFDVLFEVFHQLLFPSGSYTFDPTTERLVQLFPFRFWQESAIALGAVAILVALVVAAFAHRRAAAGGRRATAAGSSVALEGGR